MQTLSWVRACTRSASRRELLRLTAASIAYAGVFALNISQTGVQAMPSDANNFYKSDAVEIRKVTFKNQYNMELTGITAFFRQHSGTRCGLPLQDAASSFSGSVLGKLRRWTGSGRSQCQATGGPNRSSLRGSRPDL